jgi:hypothetical protein
MINVGLVTNKPHKVETSKKKGAEGERKVMVATTVVVAVGHPRVAVNLCLK